MAASLVKRVGMRLKREAMSVLTDRRWSDAAVPCTWVGSPAGGAWVSLPRLSARSVIYSFGIAFEISFDRDIITRTGGCSVFAYDPDPRSLAWLKAGDTWVPPQLRAFQCGLAERSGTRPFGITDTECMTGSLITTGYNEIINADFFTLPELMERNGHTFVDFVKMDVEGAEYAIVEDWLATGWRPPVGQLWIEFHPNAESRGQAMTDRLVRDMSRIGFRCVKRVYRERPCNYLLLRE